MKIMVGENIGEIGTNHQCITMANKDRFDAGAVGCDGHGGSGLNWGRRVKNQDVDLAGFQK